jgi:hypothetical protein
MYTHTGDPGRRDLSKHKQLYLYVSTAMDTVQSAAAPRMLAQKYVLGMRYSRLCHGRYIFLNIDFLTSAARRPMCQSHRGATAWHGDSNLVGDHDHLPLSSFVTVGSEQYFAANVSYTRLRCSNVAHLASAVREA